LNIPWSNYFRLGIVHFMAYPEVAKDESRVLPTLEALAADTDFEVVEVRGVSSPELRREIKALCRTAHLDLAYGAQPAVLGQKLNPNSLDAAERQRAMQVLKAAVDEAVEMGAQGFALLSGKDPGDADRDAAVKALTGFLIELSQYAQQVGNLPVYLEVFDRDIDKKSLVGPHSLAAAIAEEVRAEAPNFALMVDLSHLPLLKESPEEALTAVKGYIGHAHCGNCVMRDPGNVAYGDLHPGFGFEGGENDVDELADYLYWLFKVGYLREGAEERPVLSFEVQPVAPETSAAVIAGAKRTLAKAWAKLSL
jgi:sugar phosphate isomerase/epimerase